MLKSNVKEWDDIVKGLKEAVEYTDKRANRLQYVSFSDVRLFTETRDNLEISLLETNSGADIDIRDDKGLLQNIRIRKDEVERISFDVDEQGVLLGIHYNDDNYESLLFTI